MISNSTNLKTLVKKASVIKRKMSTRSKIAIRSFNSDRFSQDLD